MIKRNIKKIIGIFELFFKINNDDPYYDYALDFITTHKIKKKNFKNLQV